MQIHADKRAAILKFYTRKTADRKRAIFRRIPARRELNNLPRYHFAPRNFYLRLQLILLSIIYVFQQRVFRLKTLRLS